MNDVNRCYHANGDAVAIAHYDERRMRILVRQNLGDVKNRRLQTQHR